jgi:hypothetical protein
MASSFVIYSDYVIVDSEGLRSVGCSQPLHVQLVRIYTLIHYITGRKPDLLLSLCSQCHNLKTPQSFTPCRRSRASRIVFRICFMLQISVCFLSVWLISRSLSYDNLRLYRDNLK